MDTIRKSPDSVHIPEVLDDRDVVLCIDIFFIGGLMFLTSISTNLKYIIASHIVDRSSESLLSAISKQVSTYRSKNYRVAIILCDGELGISHSEQEINNMNIELSICSKNEHIHLIERAGRQMKERVRACWSIIPYNLSNIMIIHLVYYCVNAINIFPKQNSINNMSPRELLLGRNVDINKDFKVMFGEYVQVSEHNSITNDMSPLL
jgi:hypothetical protein